MSEQRFHVRCALSTTRIVVDTVLRVARVLLLLIDDIAGGLRVLTRAFAEGDAVTGTSVVIDSEKVGTEEAQAGTHVCHLDGLLTSFLVILAIIRVPRFLSLLHALKRLCPPLPVLVV